MADEPGGVSIYALDVGQGDCTFILDREPEAGAILFDCNDAYVAERFVVDHGIRTLHAVVVSHLDRDHIAGMLPFLRWFISSDERQLGRIYIGRDRPKLGEVATQLVHQALEWADQKRCVLYPPTTSDVETRVYDTGHWSASIVLPRYERVLADSIQEEDDPNRVSVALRVACGGNAMLIGGDVPLVSWEDLPPELLSCSVFRAPHHGGGIGEDRPTWSERDLYTRSSPDTVIVSVGSKNQYEHPTESHINGIEPGKRRLVCTQLTPRCHDDLPGVRKSMLKAASGVAYSSYRHVYRQRGDGLSRPPRPRDEVPCAGSVLVELNTDGRVEVTPTRGGWHDRLLDNLRLRSPRCRPA